MGCSEPFGGSRSSKRPLFVRVPLLGLGLAAAGGLLFGILVLSLRRPSRFLTWDDAVCQAMHRRAVRHSPSRLAFMQFCAALGREWALVITLLLGLYWLARRRWRQL